MNTFTLIFTTVAYVVVRFLINETRLFEKTDDMITNISITGLKYICMLGVAILVVMSLVSICNYFSNYSSLYAGLGTVMYVVSLGISYQVSQFLAKKMNTSCIALVSHK